jgi:hypothetical protein
MTPRVLPRRFWFLTTAIAAALAIVLDTLGRADVGTLRLAITTAWLAPGLVLLFAINGGNPHFDIAGADDILLVVASALFWGTVVWGVLLAVTWVRRRGAHHPGTVPPAA